MVLDPFAELNRSIKVSEPTLSKREYFAVRIFAAMKKDNPADAVRAADLLIEQLAKTPVSESKER